MLRTLRDAGEYIQQLPRATHQRPGWQIAAEMLLEAVEGKGPLMFAEIAMRKAVNAGKPAPEPTPQGQAVAALLGMTGYLTLLGPFSAAIVYTTAKATITIMVAKANSFSIVSLI